MNGLLEGIKDALAKGDQVQLVGFGAFKVKNREARQTRNSRTGEIISLPATKVPVFKVGKILKDSI
ncbi:HU family DNA-binding protein [Pelotomaculum propionicicum]|uniref:HU family DNA-binding protein n=1 Tax=Pelotomaculum propionicicum TaxID=258475 RepID=UPI003B78808D